MNEATLLSLIPNVIIIGWIIVLSFYLACVFINKIRNKKNLTETDFGAYVLMIIILWGLFSLQIQSLEDEAIRSMFKPVIIAAICLDAIIGGIIGVAGINQLLRKASKQK